MSTGGWRGSLSPEKAQESRLLGAPRRALSKLRAHQPLCLSTTVLQSMKLGVDVNRHKEVIVKAISAVLLLLLKHFKLNHVYQVPARPAVFHPPAMVWQCCPPALESGGLGLHTP